MLVCRASIRRVVGLRSAGAFHGEAARASETAGQAAAMLRTTAKLDRRSQELGYLEPDTTGRVSVALAP
jgi:hypothetical protein